jgi:hypothetical protein
VWGFGPTGGDRGTSQAAEDDMVPRQGAEELHRVRGSIDVAMNVIDRAVVLYAQTATAAEAQVVDQLTQAISSLVAAAGALDDKLRTKTLGPAA